MLRSLHVGDLVVIDYGYANLTCYVTKITPEGIYFQSENGESIVVYDGNKYIVQGLNVPHTVTFRESLIKVLPPITTEQQIIKRRKDIPPPVQVNDTGKVTLRSGVRSFKVIKASPKYLGVTIQIDNGKIHKLSWSKEGKYFEKHPDKLVPWVLNYDQ